MVERAWVTSKRWNGTSKREFTFLSLFYLHRFLEKCGSKLVCLRLSCCQFVDNEVIKSLCQCCPNLEGVYFMQSRALLSEPFSEFSNWCQECLQSTYVVTNQSERVTFSNQS